MNIVIVGGGTSGWLTASTLLYKTHPKNNIKITLIESKDIPIIGVGESVTGRMRDIILNHEHLGDEKEFLRETGSTFKYGIKHVDWYKKGDHFISPIGSDFVNYTKFPTMDYDYIRIHHIAEKLKYELPVQNQLMLKNKLFNDEDLQYQNDSAYHIDAYKTGDYLRKKCLNTGRIKRIESTIENINLNSLGGVKSLRLSNDKEIKGDFFIDCTGWSKILINKVNGKFKSFRDNLLVNKAIIFPRPINENEVIKNYTIAKARNFGWTFDLPLQDRVGRGYVFNGDMISVDEAVEEMNDCYNEQIDVKKVIDFKSGRLENMWTKNVLAVGLSSSFVEPLEATAIHTTVLQFNHFMEYYFNNNLNMYEKKLHEQYNTYMNNYMDNVRDFITFHYISPRNDTDFWIESSSSKRWSDELNTKMDIWKNRMPRNTDYFYKGIDMNVGNSLWLQVGMGMNLFDSDIAKKELNYYGLNDRAKEVMNDILNYSTNYLKNCKTTNEYYGNL